MSASVGIQTMRSDSSQVGIGAAEDRDWMARIADGDGAAFALLYDRLAAAAYAFALQILGDPAQAQDVVQDAFLTCWRQARSFDIRRGSARTWLLSIVHHRAVDHLRSARHQRECWSADEHLHRRPDATDVEGEVCRRADLRQTRAALCTLPLEQRRVVELAYFHGYRYPEIAAMLSIPLGTVKSRLRLALARLGETYRGQEARSAYCGSFAG